MALISESHNLPPHEELPTFGKRLRWAIEHKQDVKTQAALARLMDVKAPYIAELVRREDAPGKDQTHRLSELLSVPEVWLAYGVTDARSDRVAEGRPRYAGWDPSQILDILDRESRSAEKRASLAETHARAAEVEARAADKRAEAAKEWAVAARLAEENARDLRWGIFSSDPVVDAVAEQAEESVESVSEEETGPEISQPKPDRQRPRRQPPEPPRSDGS